MGSTVDKYNEHLDEEREKLQSENRLLRKNEIIAEIKEMSDEDFRDFAKVFDEKRRVLEFFKTMDILRFRLNK